MPKQLGLTIIALLILSQTCLPSQEASPIPKKVKILYTCYFAPRWSEHGAYRRVSQNGKRLGNYIALNFLPSGSVVMIPSVLKTTKLIVADTMANHGIGSYEGKKYWKVDILRNEKEWIDDFDAPQELVIVKINKNGRFRDNIVYENYQTFLRQISPDQI